MKISYKILKLVMEKDVNSKNFENKLYLNELGKLERKAKDLVLLTSEEIYYNFCKEYPSVSKRAKIRYIVSYIGIRLASLSKIRKNVKINYCN